MLTISTNSLVAALAELEPKYAKAYYKKALTCKKAELLKEALKAYKEFLKYGTQNDTIRIKYAKKRIEELELK